MSKKWALTICIVLIIAIAGVSGYMRFTKTATYTDSYGFTHNAEGSGKTYAVDENVNRDYALVELDKDEVSRMSEHDFINKVAPILNGYSDKIYTTFMFEDGTGICFPYSSTKYVAAYGETDEEGNIVNEIGTITISGTSVTYKEIDATVSAETSGIYDYIPEQYLNDDLAACAEADGIYVAISQTAEGDEDAQAIADEFVTNFRDYDMTGITKFYVVLNRTYGFSVNPRTLTAARDDDVIKEALNKAGIY